MNFLDLEPNLNSSIGILYSCLFLYVSLVIIPFLLNFMECQNLCLHLKEGYSSKEMLVKISKISSLRFV